MCYRLFDIMKLDCWYLLRTTGCTALFHILLFDLELVT